MGRWINRKAPATIKLEDGTAAYMGDGIFVVDQIDESRKGPARFLRTVLTLQDLEAMRAAA